MRRLLLRVVLLITVLATPFAFSSATPALTAASNVRDLAVAPPQSVGIDPTRVKRIDAFMKQWVDEGRLSSIVTMLNREEPHDC